MYNSESETLNQLFTTNSKQDSIRLIYQMQFTTKNTFFKSIPAIVGVVGCVFSVHAASKLDAYVMRQAYEGQDLPAVLVKEVFFDDRQPVDLIRLVSHKAKINLVIDSGVTFTQRCSSLSLVMADASLPVLIDKFAHNYCLNYHYKDGVLTLSQRTLYVLDLPWAAPVQQVSDALVELGAFDLRMLIVDSGFSLRFIANYSVHKDIQKYVDLLNAGELNDLPAVSVASSTSATKAGDRSKLLLNSTQDDNKLDLILTKSISAESLGLRSFDSALPDVSVKNGLPVLVKVNTQEDAFADLKADCVAFKDKINKRILGKQITDFKLEWIPTSQKSSGKNVGRCSQKNLQLVLTRTSPISGFAQTLNIH